MRSPGKTTLYRMQQAAQAELDRLDLIKSPPQYISDKRDDFAGIVRLIGAILADRNLIGRLKASMGLQMLLATDTDVAVADQKVGDE